MDRRGDTQRQATLRDRLVKRSEWTQEEVYLTRILEVLRPEMTVLDIGCGTGHIISELGTRSSNCLLIGLDISPAMLQVARENTRDLQNIVLLKGDGYALPAKAGSIDVVLARLADYSAQDVHRVLREDGRFIEYGLGPEANREIAECFPDRTERENFFIPQFPETWREEVCRELVLAGFSIASIDDYKRIAHYRNVEEVMDLVEVVPLVKGFDRQKDRRVIEELAERQRTERGIGITWHYRIIEARRKPE